MDHHSKSSNVKTNDVCVRACVYLTLPLFSRLHVTFPMWQLQLARQITITEICT